MTMTIYARLDVRFIGLMMARTEVHHIEIQAPDLPLFALTRSVVAPGDN